MSYSNDRINRMNQVINDLDGSNSFTSEKNAKLLNEMRTHLYNMNPSRVAQKSSLHPPSTQMRLTGASHPDNMGLSVLEYSKMRNTGLPQSSVNQSLFFKSYIDHKHAILDHNNLSTDFKRYAKYMNIKGRSCRILPPLLARYYPPTHRELTIPIRFNRFGEMIVDKTNFDILLRFNAYTHAITLVLCSFSPEREAILNLCIMALYGIHDEDYVNNHITSWQQFKIRYESKKNNFIV